MVTLAQCSATKNEFLNITIFRKRVTWISNRGTSSYHVQGGTIGVTNNLETLLNVLPEKFDVLRESDFAQTSAPKIHYVWFRMYDIETIEKRKRR